MSLRQKTFALFLVLGISFCLGSYAVLNIAVFPAFEEFERESVDETLTRVTRMLDSDLRALEIMNIEYSSWDQTYAYARGQMPEYAEQNLDPAYWHSVSVHLMMIYDADGKQLFARISDPSDGSELALEDELRFIHDAKHPIIRHETKSDSVRGLIDTRSGVMQVVSYPVLTSEGHGPIAGSLIVGQTLTDARIQELGERGTANLSIIPLADSDMAARLDGPIRNILAAEDNLHVEADDESIRGYRVLDDILGKPVAIVEVSAPRRITQIGANTIRTTMIALATASAIFLLSALLFLQRLITAPITKLTNRILDIRESGDLRVDIGSNRSDEIGILAKEFGELTIRLNDAKSELESTRDEALAMSRTKSEFLARMSHEIRTPMNGVLGMTELLQNTSLNDKQQRFARTIYQSAESLLHIINDILDISKIEAGKIDLDIAPFNLQHLVEECLDLLAETAHSKGLELICAIPVDTNVHLRGDPVRLRQVLMNLIGNAIKFTAQGEIIVRATSLSEDSETANFRIEVEDTGVGINPTNAEKIFEPFTQEDGSTTRRYGGTGLGLSISKQLVELMGGEIGVKSAKRNGCIFWFTARFDEDQAPHSHPRANLLAGKAVFVIDDNETNREILRHQLEGWRMRVEVACSGPEALNLLRANTSTRPQFDIMLLDMAMPGMNGLQLAHAIRQKPTYSQTPLVMLSSISRANAIHEQNAADPDDWLAKPVRQALLHDTLLSVLSKTAVEAAVGDGKPASGVIDAGQAEEALRVLLVDDGEVNLAVANGMLGTMGHEITMAKNGLEATAAFKARLFDIVFMDCRMPEMDGYEATREIRAWEKQHGRKPTPIIALTAHALEGDREKCLAAGMSDYLTKPFKMDELGSVLAANVIAGVSTAAERPQVLNADQDPALDEDAPAQKTG